MVVNMGNGPPSIAALVSGRLAIGGRAKYWERLKCELTEDRSSASSSGKM